MTQATHCHFCTQPDLEIENDLAYATFDTNPVSPGHCLVMPKRHVAEYFDATTEEKQAIWALVDEMKIIIDKHYQPDAYNLGINVGKAAGQSVPHVHVHMMPRYAGDIENPQGGVRGVIPHKQKYPKKVR
ncbi:MAG: HIT family protein [Arenicellales bacterium]